MKRGLLIWTILLVSLLIAVNVKACENTQVILRLSSSDNAHGAEWQYSAYPVEICYDEIFGFTYSGENPHSCNSEKTNKILSLSSSYNSHAEIPNRISVVRRAVEETSSPYAKICYGDLTCQAKGECSENEKLIVSLSSETNAHLSSGNNYPVKICCRVGSKVEEAYFANMQGEFIDEADKGDSVKLIVSGAGLGEVNYTIYKSNSFWFDKKVASSGARGELIWTANSSGTYYFIARLENGESLESGDLVVGDSIIDRPIELRIFNPKDKQIYFLNEALNFSAIIRDEDDRVYYSWTLGDGATKSGDSYSWGNLSFIYGYSAAGQKNIILRAWNSREQSVFKRVSILIINSSYLLAYIDTPLFGAGYRRIVRFNASSSYAVDYNRAAGEIACLMGLCPAKTEGCPPPQTGCHINVSGTPKGYDNANFSWIFDSDSRNNKTGTGLNNVIFDRLFPSIGKHTASLSISVNPSSYIETEFNILPEDTTECSLEGEDSYWYFPSGKIENSFDNCYLEEAEDICCPEYHSCYQKTEAGEGVCVLDDKLACSDYIIEEECIQDSSNVAEADIDFKTDGEEFCSSYTEEISDNCWRYSDNCRCYWNSSSSSCDSAYTMKAECLGFDPEEEGECIFTTTESGNCSLGYRFFEWEAEWTGTEYNPDCETGEEQVACLSETLLGFFDSSGLIIAIILVIIAYWIIVHNKKHHSRKKKKR